MKRTIFAGVVALMAVNLLAQTIAVRIISFPATVLPYEPVVICAEVTNTSGRPLTLAFGYHGFKGSCVVIEPDGKSTPSDQDLLAIKPALGFRLEPKPSNWQEIIQRSPSCWPTKQGVYRVAIAVTSTGPYMQPDGHQVEAWSGKAQSRFVSVEIKAPTGVDAEALRAVKGNPMAHLADILRRFPNSTYAGYALMKMGPAGYLAGSVQWNKKTPSQRDVAWLVPSAASADKQDAKRQHVRGGLQSFVEKTQAFLAMHPDFARADILRKEMANALFQLDQRDAALEQVEKLSKMKGPAAEEAHAVMIKLKKPSQQPK